MNSREQLIHSLKTFFKENATRFGFEMAFLYGSWARGFPRPDSDVDIAIVFSEKPSSDDECFIKLNALTLKLSGELKLEVNLIQIREEFDKPMLYYNAIVLGLPAYIKDFDKYIRIKNEAIYQMEDYSLFGLRWQHEVTKRNMETLKHA